MTNKGNRWIRQVFNDLKADRGGKCEIPGCEETEDLEFAHVQPTDLGGRGRGRKERYYDIKNNPDSYRLLCKGHHRDHDDELDAQTGHVGH